MKSFDPEIFKLRGIYSFSAIQSLTGISRQTLRCAAKERRLVVFRDMPSMTRGDWFLDYVTNRKSVKTGFEGTNARPQRLPRTFRTLGDADSARPDMVGMAQDCDNSIQPNTEVNP